MSTPVEDSPHVMADLGLVAPRSEVSGTIGEVEVGDAAIDALAIIATTQAAGA